MRTKKLMALLLVAAVFLTPFSATAFDGKKGGEFRKKGGQKSNSGLNFIFREARIINIYKDRLKITEEQKNKLDEVVLNVRKKILKLDAEIKVCLLDMLNELKKDAPDYNVLCDIINKKSEYLVEQEKAKVKALVKIKGILTQTQKEELKKIKRELMIKHLQKFSKKRETKRKNEIM